MNRYVALTFALLSASMLAQAASVVDPHPSCSSPLGGTWGAALGSQAFTFPESMDARKTQFKFNTGGNVGSSQTLFVIISDRERSSAGEGTPTFDSGWLRWVNISATRTAEVSQATLTIDWLNESVSQSASGLTIHGTTWGGDNTIPSTAGYRYLSAQMTGSLVDILRDRSCAEYNGYLRATSSLNSTTEILPQIFLDVWTPPPPAPDAPVLGGTNVYREVTLSWTEPANDPLGYNLTRVSPDGDIVTYALPDSPLTYTETVPFDGTWQYNITAWNAIGDSAVSNNATLNITNRPIFGDDGFLWGDDGRQALADETDFTYASIGTFYGIFITIALASTGFFVLQRVQYEWAGAIIGSIVGIAASTIFGLFNAWIVAFVAVGGIAIFTVFKYRQGGA